MLLKTPALFFNRGQYIAASIIGNLLSIIGNLKSYSSISLWQAGFIFMQGLYPSLKEAPQSD